MTNPLTTWTPYGPYQLILLLPVEPDDKEGDSVVRQRLPSLYEVHLGLQQVEVLDVGVGLQYLLPELKQQFKIGLR